MTVSEVFELRRLGRKEEAYEAARKIYATDKGAYASMVMFLTASDMLLVQIEGGNNEEALKINKALERLLSKIPEHLLLGVWGEELAVSYLREKGFVILERDWHSKHRDIDIIAQKDDYIVFVEVKTRRNRDYVEPESAVNYKKTRNLCLAINHYIHFRKLDAQWRFDVITVIGSLGTAEPEINHIEDFTLR